ncbi:MAG TPA: hypothetical protein VHF25_13030 [Nitriliruptorales bacterium]|nr:hypothetical protein [Nitriliruptorales bacterium]
MRWVVVIAASLEAAFMAVDGARALVVGDYFTPSSGEYEGQLGPWADLVGAVGIDPRSSAMKWFFVLFGLFWLAAIAGFCLRRPWSWWAMVAFAVGSLWYLVPGAVISVVVLALLLLPTLRSGYLG